MSGSVLKRPKAATCEDWDEDTQSTLPGSKTSANVAVKRAQSSDSDPPARPIKHSNEGSDSGYSSRATTVATRSSMSSERKRPSDLKLDPIFTERERTPYSYSTKPSEPQRQSKEKDSKPDQKPVKQKARHRPGECSICDELGYHIEITPPSPKVVRVSTPNVQDDAAVVARPPQRRKPSTSQPRPTSMYVGAPPVQPAYSPVYAYTTTWDHPPTPGYSYAPIPYQYSAPPTPPTYVQPSYYEQWPDYEDAAPSLTHRRMSSYGRELPTLERRPSKTGATFEKPVVREKRTATVSSKSTKNIEDSLAMPPPPRPQPAQITSHRPSTSRSQTYHESSSSSSRRQSQASEKSTSSKDAPPSPSRPPSSWRGQGAGEPAERPSLATGKSRSYTQGSDRIENAPAVRRESTQRRTTTSSVPHEQKEAEAEAYQKRKGSMLGDNLTAENLKKYTSRSPDKADAVSTTSRRSHHSSKESINGRERSATGSRGSKTNININGISLSIPSDISESSAHPVTIDLGNNICISMGGKDKENIDVRRDQKRLERAPSVASKASRQSVTSGSGVSSNDSRKMKEIEAPPKHASKASSRRSSEEQEYARASTQSSRQGSRAQSKVRKSVDYSTRPEFYYKDEATVYGA